MGMETADTLTVHVEVGGTHHKVNFGTACNFSVAADTATTTNKCSTFKSSVHVKKGCTGGGSAILDPEDVTQNAILNSILNLSSAYIEMKAIGNKKLDGVANFLTWDVAADDGNVKLFTYTFEMTGEFAFVAI